MADARVAEAKRLIDGLRRDRRQLPYRGRGEYSKRAREAAGAITDMIESGGAADAVPLARRAVERVTAATLHMDDSSGIVGGDLRMLTALYARASDAERWARRGLAEDPAGYWADGLRGQLAGLLLASGRGEEAVCVHRAEFERRTLHQDYSRLRDTAERAGQWPGAPGMGAGIPARPGAG